MIANDEFFNIESNEIVMCHFDICVGEFCLFSTCHERVMERELIEKERIENNNTIYAKECPKWFH